MNPRGLPPISPQARAVAEANNLASLLEAAAKGLKHRRHQRTLGPARAAIKGVMASYFSRQKAALLAAIEPEIKIALWHQPPPVLREAATPKGKRFAASLIPTSLSPLKFEVTNEERNDFDRAITESSEEYVISGEKNLLDSQDLASNMKRLRDLFELFDRKTQIIQILDSSTRAQGVQIFIGGESGIAPLDECSVVTAPYEVDGQVVGTVGVIGPTRMAYERIIPIVDITARLLSSALSQH